MVKQLERRSLFRFLHRRAGSHSKVFSVGAISALSCVAEDLCAIISIHLQTYIIGTLRRINDRTRLMLSAEMTAGTRLILNSKIRFLHGFC